jgi:hypothetical protein
LSYWLLGRLALGLSPYLLALSSSGSFSQQIF